MGNDSQPAPTLRAARPGDEPFQHALFRARRAGPLRLAGVPERVIENLMSTQYRARVLSYERAHPDALWLIVEHTKNSIGELVVDLRPDTAHIIDITLTPERQGRGLGHAVIRAVLRDIAPHREISALVDINNPSSRKMFAKAGFVEHAYDDVHLQLLWRQP